MTRKTSFKITLLFLAGIFLLNPFLSAEQLDTEAIVEALRHSFTWFDNVSFEVSVTYVTPWNPDETVKVDSIYYQDGNRRARLIDKASGFDRITGEPLSRESDITDYRDRIYSPETKGFMLEILGEDPCELNVHEDGPQELEHLMQTLAHAYFYNGKFLEGALKLENIISVREGDLDGEPSVILETTHFDRSLTFWLSPQDGYAMQKWQRVREVEIDVETAGETAPPEKKVQRKVEEFTFSDRQNIQGHIVPMTIESIYCNEVDGRREITFEKKSVFSNVQISPDFDSFQAFKLPDVSHIHRSALFKPNGMIIPGYRWKDGDLELLFEEDEIYDAWEDSDQQKEYDPEEVTTVLSLSTGAPEAAVNEGWNQARIVMLLTLALFLLVAALGIHYFLKRKSL